MTTHGHLNPYEKAKSCVWLAIGISLEKSMNLTPAFQFCIFNDIWDINPSEYVRNFNSDPAYMTLPNIVWLVVCMYVYFSSKSTCIYSQWTK